MIVCRITSKGVTLSILVWKERTRDFRCGSGILTRNVMQTPLEVQDTRRVHGDFEDLVGMLY